MPARESTSDCQISFMIEIAAAKLGFVGDILSPASEFYCSLERLHKGYLR